MTCIRTLYFKKRSAFATEVYGPVAVTESVVGEKMKSLSNAAVRVSEARQPNIKNALRTEQLHQRVRGQHGRSKCEISCVNVISLLHAYTVGNTPGATKPLAVTLPAEVAQQPRKIQFRSTCLNFRDSSSSGAFLSFCDRAQRPGSRLHCKSVSTQPITHPTEFHLRCIVANQQSGRRFVRNICGNELNGDA